MYDWKPSSASTRANPDSSQTLSESGAAFRSPPEHILCLIAGDRVQPTERPPDLRDPARIPPQPHEHAVHRLLCKRRRMRERERRRIQQPAVTIEKCMDGIRLSLRHPPDQAVKRLRLFPPVLHQPSKLRTARDQLVFLRTRADVTSGT